MPPRHTLWLLLFASAALCAQQQPVPLSQLQQQAEARQAELERKQAPLGFRPGDVTPQIQPAVTAADPRRPTTPSDSCCSLIASSPSEYTCRAPTVLFQGAAVPATSGTVTAGRGRHGQ